MSINKRKILQSAQKHLQKGALDKALKDYQTLLEADPKDVNLRLKVGDLHLRLGRSDDAVTAYLKVADRFMKDGFDAKAVALYKQITRIDAKRVDIYVPLAELYQRLGLTADAMGALQTAADAQYRDGNKPAALELLRKMASLDPSNTTSRLKVAELLRQEGMHAEAFAEFGAVADELERQGEVEGRASVLAKMVELDPEHVGALERLGRCMVAMRKWSQASEIARRLVDRGSESNVEGYEILAEACQGLRREDELPEIYKALAQALRERGADDRAREIAQRFTSGTVAASTTDAVILDGEERESVDAAIGGSGTFGSESFEDSGFVTDAGLRAPPRGERDGVDGRMRATAHTPFTPPPLSPATPVETAAPEPEEAGDTLAGAAAAAVDPDQILAEASVYVRYGKHERAIESLRVLLASDPGHLRALEKFSEACTATGQIEEATGAWRRAAELARDAGDAEGFGALRARLEEIDPAAAGALGPAPEVEDATDETGTGDAGEGEPEIDLPLEGEVPAGDDDGLEIEIDELDVSDVDDSLAAAGDALSLDFDAGPTGAAPPHGSEAEMSFGEVALADSQPPFDPGAETMAPGSALDLGAGAADAELEGSDAAAEAEPAGGDLEFDIDVEAPAAESPDLAPAAGAGAGAVAAETSGPASTSARAAAIAEELETAAFFLAQGMLDEAEDVCRRVLEAAPSHPQALLRLGEIESLRADGAEPPGGTPDDDTTGQIAAPVAAAAAAAAPTPAPPMPAPEPIASAQAVAPEPPAAPPEASPTGAGLDVEIDLDLGSEGEAAPLTAPAAAPVAPPPAASAAAPAAAGPRPVAAAPVATPVAAAAPVLAHAAAADEHADGSVDLDLGLDDDEEAPAAVVPQETVAPPQAAAEQEAGDFDLAAELSDALGDEPSPMSALGAEGTEEEGFRQVFAAFKAGVEKQLGAQDYEARYDLGIAYREMGLFDDAIGEFRTALDGPNHKLQCLHMLGLCALDLGRAADATAHLEQALAWPELPAEQQTALRFDLGRAHAAAGDRARARAAWEAVAAADPAFADVREQLAALDAPEADPDADDETDDAGGEAFESFDDLIEEGAASEARSAQPPAERFESFDDLMDDADDEGGEAARPERAARDERGADETLVAEITASELAEADEDASEAELTDEPEAAPADEPEPAPAGEPEPAPPPPPAARHEPGPPTGGGPARPRRKKISFV